jgi:hypothetical protein
LYLKLEAHEAHEQNISAALQPNQFLRVLRVLRVSIQVCSEGVDDVDEVARACHGGEVAASQTEI